MLTETLNSTHSLPLIFMACKNLSGSLRKFLLVDLLRTMTVTLNKAYSDCESREQMLTAFCATNQWPCPLHWNGISHVSVHQCCGKNIPGWYPARADSGVVRIDPLRFLAGCHKRRLNQAYLCLSYILACFTLYCCLLGPLFMYC